ncbi:MAG: N-acetylmuramoyl-L-alanine amidase [Chloroflexota bacterium]|nr:N-acetylmuramoyl-L-alanine amidase [Dehalococcoidia bacterium]MDW8252442.1 N-acetylmuramoyl-L-alanine amidase [Chloroflexota bacterium]
MRALIRLLVLLAATLPLPPPAAAQAADYPIRNGWFFTQTAGGQPGGYSVTDDGAPFWTSFRQLGGVDALGYPVSRRMLWDGQPAQAFQKGVLHWRPDLNRMVLVNVFDELTKAGKDPWLREVRLVPRPQPIPDEDKLDFGTITVRRLALLEANPAISARYWAADDPLTFYGLPVSPIEDYGSVAVVRLQRAVLQQWKTNRPWARAGDVVVANGGDVAKEAGLFPAAATAPEPPGGAPPGPLPVVSAASPAPVVTPYAATAPLPTSTPRSAAPAGPAGSPLPTVTPTATPAPSSASAGLPAAPSQRAADLTFPLAIPTAPPPPPEPPGGYIIALDPGHGGPDSGATVRFDDGFILREKDVNLTVSRKLAQFLREAGFAVVMTRDSDVAVNRERRDLNGDGAIDMRDELQARIDIANAAKAHLFLSIHHNGHERTELNGLEIYSCGNREFAAQNRRLAALAEDSILRAVRAAGYPLASRGQKDCYNSAVDKSYFVIGPVDLAAGRPRATAMPGIIGEAMFITNPADAAALRSDAILTAQARGYLEAVRRYFGK